MTLKFGFTRQAPARSASQNATTSAHVAVQHETRMQKNVSKCFVDHRRNPEAE
jgi:hypothetical protein